MCFNGEEFLQYHNLFHQNLDFFLFLVRNSLLDKLYSGIMLGIVLT